MAKKTVKASRRKHREGDKTEFRTIWPEDWAKICGIPWTEATRILIGHMLVGNGQAKADVACCGAWSRVNQTNHLLIKHGLPFRIRGHELPRHEWTGDGGYEIQKRGIRLEQVVREFK